MISVTIRNLADGAASPATTTRAAHVLWQHMPVISPMIKSDSSTGTLMSCFIARRLCLVNPLSTHAFVLPLPVSNLHPCQAAPTSFSQAVWVGEGSGLPSCLACKLKSRNQPLRQGSCTTACHVTSQHVAQHSQSVGPKDYKHADDSTPSKPNSILTSAPWANALHT